MNSRSKIAALTCALVIPAGLAVATHGSADASSAKHHGWPSSTKMSSDQITKQANGKEGTHAFTVIEHEVRTADVDTGDPARAPATSSSSRAACSTHVPATWSGSTRASA